MSQFNKNIPDNVISLLNEDDITTPTPIQIASYPLIQEGNDVYLHAQTGSGKTLAYLLPLMTKMNCESKDLQIVILAPSHELASQIIQVIRKFAPCFQPEFKAQLLLGETSLKRQIEKLKKKPQIVVGTVGRIEDLIQSKKLKMHKVKTVIIDEADRLLAAPSLKSVEKVIQSTLKERQLIYVSATKNDSANKLAEKQSPDLIFCEPKEAINPNMTHAWLHAEKDKKIEGLRTLLKVCKPEKAMIFVHHQETAEFIKKSLRDKKVVELSGAQDKQDRQKNIEDFRKGNVTLMVCTDVSARGLDIPNVSHIIQYDLPQKSDNYLHRAGRSGRAGKEGGCISLVTGKEEARIQEFAEELGIEIQNLDS